jgi:hypothetical protein
MAPAQVNKKNTSRSITRKAFEYSTTQVGLIPANTDGYTTTIDEGIYTFVRPPG